MRGRRASGSARIPEGDSADASRGPHARPASPDLPKPGEAVPDDNTAGPACGVAELEPMALAWLAPVLRGGRAEWTFDVGTSSAPAAAGCSRSLRDPCAPRPNRGKNRPRLR